MLKTLLSGSLLIFFISLSGCCTIAPPEINMTGEKTVIERQIVGDYRELEKDAWIISSVRTNVQKKKGEQKAVDEVFFKAMRAREEVSGKLRGYKDEGALGEGNDGYIKLMSLPKYESDQKLKEMLTKTADAENSARKTIFERTAVKSGIKAPKKSDIEPVGIRFADEQRALAKKNDWVQEKSGKWDRKK
jgi:hypothetical protein